MKIASMNRFSVFILFLTACAASPKTQTPQTPLGAASATPTVPAGYAQHGTPPEESHWIAEGRYSEIRKSVPPFPIALSQGEILDDGALISWQLHRTPEQCDRANTQVHAEFEHLFPDLLSPEQVEKLQPLMKEIGNDASYFTYKIKNDYARPRPFVTIAVLDPCLPREKSAAYPSGHAMISQTYANVLADLIPGRKKDFFDRAGEVGLNRIIGGVHYPSDVEAGRNLGDLLYREFKKSKAYQKAFAEAKLALKSVSK